MCFASNSEKHTRGPERERTNKGDEANGKQKQMKARKWRQVKTD